MSNSPALVIAAAGAGIAGGLLLLRRGLAAYRAGEALRGTGTSRIASLAAGEVRVVGTIEAGPAMLVSPLQSIPCVYYHARIVEDRGRERTVTLNEERAVGFQLRDSTGTLRIFPRGARWDAPTCFHDQSDWSGGEPPGLDLNRGPGVTVGPLDRDAAVAALLTVHQPGGGMAEDGFIGRSLAVRSSRHAYEERRLAPGDVLTIVGSAVPFRDVDDPATADRDDPTLALDDPEVARDIAAAREAGLLLGSPDEASGNAAIPGFGIGLPTREPDLDPAARPMPIAPDGAATAAATTFDIAPGALVMATMPGAPLLVRFGSPGEAVGRDQGRLSLGLVGAVVAIVAALVLALALQGASG